jgi:nucleotide-binding universal stress UspA family protein
MKVRNNQTAELAKLPGWPVSDLDDGGRPRKSRRVVAAIAAFQPYSCAMSLAASLGTEILVFHVLECHPGGAFPLQTAEEARRLVRGAAFEVQLNGASATGAIVAASVNGVASQIAHAAAQWGAEVIVLGSRRHKGIRRLTGRGVRDQLLRRSNLPVVVAPCEAQSQPRS